MIANTRLREARVVASLRVRFAIFIALIFLFRTTVFSQSQQEEKARIDQILKPDQNRVNPMQAKPFYGGKGFNQTRKADTKAFYFTEKVTPKSASARDFTGLKTFLGASATVQTKSAETH